MTPQVETTQIAPSRSESMFVPATPKQKVDETSNYVAGFIVGLGLSEAEKALRNMKRDAFELPAKKRGVLRVGSANMNLWMMRFVLEDMGLQWCLCLLSVLENVCLFQLLRLGSLSVARNVSPSVRKRARS